MLQVAIALNASHSDFKTDLSAAPNFVAAVCFYLSSSEPLTIHRTYSMNMRCRQPLGSAWQLLIEYANNLVAG